MDEPRIKTAPTPCPPGWGWGYAAERYDAMGEAEKAVHAREMAERSRKAGRSLSKETNVDIQQTDDRPRELALFAGAGGGILGGKLLGWRCVCAVECDLYAASVLLARQNDGSIEPFPIWDDVRTFDGRPWRGRVDVVSGGFPCQDISVAGKGAGITGERSGLWREFARIIGEVRPGFVFVENSPALVTRGLGVVLGDLCSLGFDAKWGVVSAENSGAPHRRERLWIVANSNSAELREQSGRLSGPRWTGSAKPGINGESPDVANADCSRESQPQRRVSEQRGRASDGGWWETEPSICRVVDGVANRLDRLRCLGNGQVSAVARLAWEILNNGD